MIRFIDLGDQIVEDSHKFAWYDTKSMEGEFLHFDGRQVWDSWDEFEADFWSEISYQGEEESAYLPPKKAREDLARLKKAMVSGWRKSA